MTFLELQWHNAHAHQVTAVNPLEAFGDNGFDAEQECTFCCPVTGASCTVLFTCDNDQVLSFILILHGSIVDGHFFVRWQVLRDTALGARSNLVTDTNIGERTTHHYFMVTTT
ncbi:hypothetical protein D3C74_412580 [compost metagenome]